MRKIIHIDMDCYFAAVEMRDFPQYRGKPLAVGGSSDRRGVISTCNYEARAFGVRSAMASAYALKLCPNLILVPGRMEVYKAVSQQIREIFSRYTSLIEPLSLDEAYLDVSDCSLYQGSATRIAEAIRSDIFKETGLTASAGVSPIKFVAKVASDLNKPNGQYVVSPDTLMHFVRALSLGKIPGVGKVTEEKLNALGLKTCADVQQVPQTLLTEHFGKFGAVLYERAHGRDERAIVSHRERKSVGVETTLPKDLHTREACLDVLSSLIPELNRRLGRSASGRRIHKLVVKLKFDDFRQTTIESRAEEPSVRLFESLLSQAFVRAEGRGIRLVGIAAGLVCRSEAEQEGSAQLALSL
ncbi:DNA polymerase IV [Shewanella amazonensis]|uniref:DNA polymerase IV n=1 Tax=Shewanella amazonensis (strain ATCC BAA-1098 / SB2B) TaxID=326297 RepID=DPO4_SHEAM|nr:DNA polymerase IV [Shewanella amazonensis]A1S8M3.1 RecName: Full=DNA polymerase IV; Short=Pol IV [Shewanella amazonensis SB2B]ABM00730.1 DNA-directed DNA polymerase [Shewanella amazonensis SB2B]